MNKIKSLLYILILVALFVVGVWFASYNSQTVSLSLFDLANFEAGLGIIVLFVLFIGAFLGFVVSLWPMVMMRQQLMSQKRQLKNNEKELAKLRVGLLRE